LRGWTSAKRGSKREKIKTVRKAYTRDTLAGITAGRWGEDPRSLILAFASATRGSSQLAISRRARCHPR